jgi:hypothetical protein
VHVRVQDHKHLWGVLRLAPTCCTHGAVSRSLRTFDERLEPDLPSQAHLFVLIYANGKRFVDTAQVPH